MLEQLINNDFETILLIGLVAILVLLTAISLGYGLSAIFIDGDALLGVCAILVAVIGVCGGYVSITQLKNKLNKSKPSKKVTLKITTL